MNIENLDYLKNLVKNKGFGEDLSDKLENAIKKNEPSFSLEKTINYEDKKMDFTLNFNKGKEGDMYFFNNYDATLSSPDLPSNSPKNQTFYLDKGKGFTGKEAFNLLDGRAVYHDLQTSEKNAYKAWVMLEPSKPENSNHHKAELFGDDFDKRFDHHTALNKALGNVFVYDFGLENALMNIEKGNRIPIHRPGVDETFFLFADPREKKMQIVDSEGIAVVVNHRPQLEQAKSIGEKQPSIAANKQEKMAPKNGNILMDKQNENAQKLKPKGIKM